MAGASDISTILSQAGRIEKINQNPFVQSEVTKQILTEEEARARLQHNREVTESKKAQEITISERAKQESKRRTREDSHQTAAEGQADSPHEDTSKDVKHLIDVVV
ncbi:MAG TPA: hypothetical protein VN416_06215 [Desulfomonilia bacterium]|nr:hypothetical protein [Thermodesulfobacteriota bacterium]HWR68598.1 hypothetical protein [Desulfomonilia bacterium]